MFRSKASMLESVHRLYEQGLLCSCHSVILVEKETANDTVLVRQLIHDTECTGKDKVKEMLGFPIVNEAS